MRSEWSEYKLLEVTKILSGGTPKSGVPDYWGDDVRWITPKDLGQLNSEYVADTNRRISRLGLDKSSAKLVRENSVILSTRAPIGHLAINTEPMATNQGCRGLIPADCLDTKFLYYFLLKNVSFLNELGTGATFKELSKTVLENVLIRLPSIPEQKCIVAIIDQAFAEIDKAHANAEQNLKNIRELFESYLQQVFSQQGKGWVEKTIEEVADLSRGHNPPKSQFIYEPKDGYVRFYQIRDGKSDKHAVYVQESTKLHYVKKDDILMVAYRHIGRVFRGVEGAFNVALCKISNRDKNQIHDDYLYNIIPSAFVKGELLKASERSLIPSMSVKHLAGLKIPVPPIEDQKEIVRKINEIQKECLRLEDRYSVKLRALEELKKSTLQKAFTGELTGTKNQISKEYAA